MSQPILRQQLHRGLQLLGLRLFSMTSSVIIIVFLGRLGGADELGAYLFLRTILVLLAVISFLGLDNLALREVVRDPVSASSYFRRGSVVCSTIGICLCLFICAILYTSSWDLLYSQCMLILTVAVVATVMINIVESLCIALGQLPMYARSIVIECSFTMLISVWLIFFGYGILSLFVCFAFARMATLIFLLARLQQPLGLGSEHAHVLSYRDLFSAVSLFSVINIVGMLYHSADIFVVTLFEGERSVGYYGPAKNMVGVMGLVSVSLVTMLYPTLSETYQNQRTEEHRTVSVRLVQCVFWLSIPLTLLLYFGSEPCVWLLFGNGFEPTVLVLKLLGLTVLPSGLSFVFSRMLFSANRQGVECCILVVTLFLGTALLIVCTKMHGAYGAAMAVVTTTYAMLLMHIVFTRANGLIGYRELISAIAKPQLLTSAFLGKDEAVEASHHV